MEPGKDCCMVAESTHLKFRIAAEHVAIFSSPSAEPAPIAAVSPFKIKNKSFERTVAEGPIEVKGSCSVICLALCEELHSFIPPIEH